MEEGVEYLGSRNMDKQCSCGELFTEQIMDSTILQVNHAGRHGIVWLRNNETWIRRAFYGSPKTPRQRHVGTFGSLEDAKTALVKALSRARH